MKSAWKDTLVDYEDDDLIQRIEKHDELPGWSGRCWVLHLNIDYGGHDKFVICATHSDPDTDPIMVTPVKHNGNRWQHHTGSQMFQTDDPKPYDEVVEQVKEELLRYHNN